MVGRPSPTLLTENTETENVDEFETASMEFVLFNTSAQSMQACSTVFR